MEKRMKKAMCFDAIGLLALVEVEKVGGGAAYYVALFVFTLIAVNIALNLFILPIVFEADILPYRFYITIGLSAIITPIIAPSSIHWIHRLYTICNFLDNVVKITCNIVKITGWIIVVVIALSFVIWLIYWLVVTANSLKNSNDDTIVSDERNEAAPIESNNNSLKYRSNESNPMQTQCSKNELRLERCLMVVVAITIVLAYVVYRN